MILKALKNKLLRPVIQSYDAYRVLRVMNQLKDLDQLIDQCMTTGFDKKTSGRLRRYCKLLWHNDVFNQAIDMMKHNLDNDKT